MLAFFFVADFSLVASSLVMSLYTRSPISAFVSSSFSASDFLFSFFFFFFAITSLKWLEFLVFECSPFAVIKPETLPKTSLNWYS